MKRSQKERSLWRRTNFLPKIIRANNRSLKREKKGSNTSLESLTTRTMITAIRTTIKDSRENRITTRETTIKTIREDSRETTTTEANNTTKATGANNNTRRITFTETKRQNTGDRRKRINKLKLLDLLLIIFLN